MCAIKMCAIKMSAMKMSAQLRCGQDVASLNSASRGGGGGVHDVGT